MRKRSHTASFSTVRIDTTSVAYQKSAAELREMALRYEVAARMLVAHAADLEIRSHQVAISGEPIVASVGETVSTSISTKAPTHPAVGDHKSLV